MTDPFSRMTDEFSRMDDELAAAVTLPPVDNVIRRAGAVNRASTAAAAAVITVGALGGITAVAQAGLARPTSTEAINPAAPQETLPPTVADAHLPAPTTAPTHTPEPTVTKTLAPTAAVRTTVAPAKVVTSAPTVDPKPEGTPDPRPPRTTRPPKPPTTTLPPPPVDSTTPPATTG